MSIKAIVRWEWVWLYFPRGLSSEQKFSKRLPYAFILLQSSFPWSTGLGKEVVPKWKPVKILDQFTTTVKVAR